MRGFALLLVLFAGLSLAPAAHAVFYNDSNVIEIGDGLPPEPSEEDGGAGGTGGTAGEAGTGSSSEGGSSEGGSSSSGGGSSSVSQNGSTGGAAGGSPASGGFSSVPSDGSGEEESSSGAGGTEEDLINLLIAGGALSGVESGGTAEEAGASDSSAGALGAGGSLGGFGSDSVLSVTVSGSKVREALRGKYDLQDILESWRSKASGKFGAREYGLIAASTALRDGNVEAVSFTASAFELTYRSRGYLLAIIPWSFPVRATIVPEAASATERVKLKLPWYRFFVRKFFTTDGLIRDIDAIVTQTVAAGSGEKGGTARVFEAVSDFLRRKVGTIQDSILLGTPS